jgi:hypothetical protein
VVREDVLDPSRADVLDLACDYAALREAVDRALIGIGFVPPEDPVKGVKVLAGMARGDVSLNTDEVMPSARTR